MTDLKKHRYHEGVGRRKTAVARVRIVEGKGEGMVNGKTVEKYFPLQTLRDTAFAPLEALKMKSTMHFTAQVGGGGIHAQAEAVRHGIARALVKWDKELTMRLRALGFMTRDPRMVERKKYGLKKARRAPQWAKR